MKKIILITLAAAAGVGAYLLVHNSVCTNDPEKNTRQTNRERHLIDAFSNAKQRAVS